MRGELAHALGIGPARNADEHPARSDQHVAAVERPRRLDDTRVR